ncbi:MAG: MFS transporter [Paracoccaceae bacterium]
MQLIAVARSSRAAGAGLAAIGIFWGGFAACLPEYKARAGVDDAGLGALLLLAAVGGMTAMALAPRVQARLGGAVLPVLAAGVVLAAIGPLLIASPASLGAVLLVMGLAMAALDIAANVRISVDEAATGLPLMNFNHALFSFGFAGAAALTGLARRAGAGPELIAPALAGVLAVFALLMIERSRRPVPPAPAHDSAPASPWRAILPAALILFAAFVAENATETWSALHIERTLGGPAGEGAFGPAMLGLTMGIGRLSGQMLASRLGEARLVAFSAALGMAGALVVALAPVQWVAVLGVALIGLGCAVVVPSANSLLGRAVRADQRAFAISRAWLLGFTGFFIGPVAMGLIAQGAGLRWSFAAIVLVLSLILPGLARLCGRTAQ